MPTNHIGSERRDCPPQNEKELECFLAERREVFDLGDDRVIHRLAEPRLSHFLGQVLKFITLAQLGEDFRKHLFVAARILTNV